MGFSSGIVRFNTILAVLFICVVGLVLYSVIAPWDGGGGPPADDTTEKGVGEPPPAPQEPPSTPKAPPPQEEGTAKAANSQAGGGSAPAGSVQPQEAAGTLSAPDPGEAVAFAKDWYFQSVIGDIVELDFGDGTGRDVQVGKPFDTPEGERATIVEIGPERQTVIVERQSDGRRFTVSRRVVVDLTTIEPSLVEAFHFSAHGLDPERLAEGVAEPVIDGRKPIRYFFAHAPSRIVFNMSAGFSRFRATGYIGGRGGKVRFVVKADDQAVFASQPVGGPGSADIVAVLPGTQKTIELIVDPLGSHGADHSFWIEPMLEK